MSVVKTSPKGLLEGKNQISQGRAAAFYKFVFTSETDSGWFDKANYGLCHFAWLSNPARTVKIFGRYRAADGTTFGETLVGDAAGVPISIDLSVGDSTDGSSFPLDVCAGFDEIKFVVSASNSDTFYIGLNG